MIAWYYLLMCLVMEIRASQTISKQEERKQKEMRKTQNPTRKRGRIIDLQIVNHYPFSSPFLKKLDLVVSLHVMLEQTILILNSVLTFQISFSNHIQNLSKV
jgi:hypothetical protein